MSDEERDQPSEEHEATVEDLEVPEDQQNEIKGGLGDIKGETI